jgi:hypothetical protein
MLKKKGRYYHVLHFVSLCPVYQVPMARHSKKWWILMCTRQVLHEPSGQELVERRMLGELSLPSQHFWEILLSSDACTSSNEWHESARVKESKGSFADGDPKVYRNKQKRFTETGNKAWSNKPDLLHGKWPCRTAGFPLEESCLYMFPSCLIVRNVTSAQTEFTHNCDIPSPLITWKFRGQPPWVWRYILLLSQKIYYMPAFWNSTLLLCIAKANAKHRARNAAKRIPG